MLSVESYGSANAASSGTEKSKSAEKAGSKIFSEFFELMFGSGSNEINQTLKNNINEKKENSSDGLSALAGILFEFELSPEMLKKIGVGDPSELKLKDVLKFIFGKNFKSFLKLGDTNPDVNINQIKSGELKLAKGKLKFMLNKEDNNLSVKLISDSKNGFGKETLNKIEKLSDFENLKITFIKNKADNEQVLNENNLNLSKNSSNNKITEAAASNANAKEIKQKDLASSLKNNNDNNSKLSKISSSNVQNDTFENNKENNSKNFLKNFDFLGNKTSENTKSNVKISEKPSVSYSNVKLEDFRKTATKVIRNTPENSTSTARINLYPKSLGRVFVEVNMKGVNAALNIKSASKETAKLIEQQLPSLKEGLKAQGINLDNIAFKLTGQENEFEGYLAERENNGSEFEEKQKYLRTFGFSGKEADKEEDEPVVKNIFRQGSYIERYI